MNARNLSLISTLEHAAYWLVVGLVFLVPFLALPFTENFLVETRTSLLVGVTLLVVILYAIKSMLQRRFELTLSPMALALAGIGAAAGISTLLTSSYPAESFLGWGGVYLSLGALALFLPGLLHSSQVWALPKSFVLGSVVLALSSLAQLAGWGPSRLLDGPSASTLPHTALFNLAGSHFIAFQLIIVALITLILLWWKLRSQLSLHLWVPSVVVLSVSALALGWGLLPGKDTTPIVLSYGANWSIVLDTFRTPLRALFGFGPESFGSAFNLLRPAWLNGTPLWNVVFTQGSNLPLTLLVTGGLLGFAGWMALAWQVVQKLKQPSSDHRFFGLVALAFLIANLLVPPTLPMIIIQFVLVTAWVIAKKDEAMELHIQGLTVRVVSSHAAHHQAATAPVLIWTVGGLLILAASFTTWQVGQAYAAAAANHQSLLAGQADQAIASYEWQQRAITLNPHIDGYRRRYATINLAIAGALSNKAELTEAERQTMAQLIQQAIREGKAAVTIDPTDSQNWQTLAQVYESLIGSAEGSEQWAVTTYTQAIQTSPQDPNVRIRLGQLLARLNQHQDALVMYQQALALKPDSATAYYNLALSLQALNQSDQAALALQRTLELLPPNSEEITQLQLELEKVQKAAADQRQARGDTRTSTDITPPPTASAAATLPPLPPETNESAEVVEPSPTTLNVTPESEALINQSDL